jgi:hypothetical protein
MDAREKAWKTAAGPKDEPQLVLWQLPDGTWAMRYSEGFDPEVAERIMALLTA